MRATWGGDPNHHYINAVSIISIERYPSYNFLFFQECIYNHLTKANQCSSDVDNQVTLNRRAYS